jgi:hypothetical protein
MMSMQRTWPIVLGIAVTAAVSGGGAGDLVHEVAVPGRSNANASLVAREKMVALAWGASTPDGVTDIYVATSRDAGRVFGTPTRVNQVAGEASPSGEQPPRIALIPRTGRDPSIMVVWGAKSAAGTRLLSARSDDGGRSFAPSTVVAGSEASGNRGWESIATASDGSVLAVWLDHRELSHGAATVPMNHGEHRHAASDPQPTDGVARAQLSKLFFGRLDDLSGARSLTGGVCYCCKTALATGRDGAVYAAWRNVYRGNVRDIAFTMSSDRGRTFATPVRVSEDQWVLDGCPENGPALTVDDQKRVHIVWPTLVPGPTSSESTLALFYARSEDGHRFTERQRIPTEGLPGHPEIALGPRGEIVVVWDEQAPGVRRIALARGIVDAKGMTRFVRQSVGDHARAVYPVVARSQRGSIVAWTSGSAGQSVLRVAHVPD